MVSSTTSTTLHLGNLAARVVLVAVAASLALWFQLESGEPSMAVILPGAVAALVLLDLLVSRHLLDLRADGDDVVIVRRRAWQPRFHGLKQTLARGDIAAVALESRSRPNKRGGLSTTCRVVLRLASGEECVLTPRPMRSSAAAEEIAREVGHLLGLEPEHDHASR